MWPLGPVLDRDHLSLCSGMTCKAIALFSWRLLKRFFAFLVATKAESECFQTAYMTFLIMDSTVGMVHGSSSFFLDTH